MSRPERYINSLEFQYLEKTVEIDFKHIYGKGLYPTQRDINNFVVDDLGVTATMLCGVQNHPRLSKVFLQFETEADIVAVEHKLQGGIIMTAKNIQVYGYRVDKPMVSIVLNGQDMSIPREEIVRVLSMYGDVVHCERGKNHDLSTDTKFVNDGTWIVRLTPRLRKYPPETIYYFGPSRKPQTWILSFDGMGSSCYLCGRQGHKGFHCNASAPRNGRLGKQPAGLGKWTEIVHCLNGGPPAQVDEGEGGGGRVRQMVNQVQGKQQKKDMNNVYANPKPSTSGLQRAEAAIPGLWKDVVKSKQNKKFSFKHGEKNATGTKNRFDILADNEVREASDDDDYVESEPEVPENSQDYSKDNKRKNVRDVRSRAKNGDFTRKRPQASSLTRYGVRRGGFVVGDFIKTKEFIEKEKTNKRKDDDEKKKRHNSNTTDNDKKITKKQKQQLANDDSTKVIEVDSEPLVAERTEDSDDIVIDEVANGKDDDKEVLGSSDGGPGDEEVGGVGIDTPTKPDKVQTGPGVEEGVGDGGAGVDMPVKPDGDKEQADEPEPDAPQIKPVEVTGLAHPLDNEDDDLEIPKKAEKLRKLLEEIH